MVELEIKETIQEFVNLINVTKMSEIAKMQFISRLTDLLNHIDAHDIGHDTEIAALKIRVKDLERFQDLMAGSM